MGGEGAHAMVGRKGGECARVEGSEGRRGGSKWRDGEGGWFWCCWEKG